MRDISLKQTAVFILLVGSLSGIPSAHSEALVAAGSESEADESTLMDHQATVFSISGEVRIVKNGTAESLVLNEGDTIEEGDAIETAPGASAEITYDTYHQNTARIEENSKVEFRSIEETELYITEGSVLSLLDGLLPGTSYDVSTPVSIAGVRGTQFERSYHTGNLEDETNVMTGKVDVTPLDAQGQPKVDQKFQVTQNQKLHFDRDMIERREFQNAKPREMPQATLQKMQEMRQNVHARIQQFSGGPGAFQHRQEKLNTLKTNPERMNPIKERVQAREFRPLNPGNANQKMNKNQQGDRAGDLRQNQMHQNPRPDFQKQRAEEFHQNQNRPQQNPAEHSKNRDFLRRSDSRDRTNQQSKDFSRRPETQNQSQFQKPERQAQGRVQPGASSGPRRRNQ